MKFVQNFPFFLILFFLFSGVLCSALKAKMAQKLTFFVLGTSIILSFFSFMDSIIREESYVYMMGHFPAPWGNEIRIGMLETGYSLFFNLLMLLCVMGGLKKMIEEIEESKQNLYWTMICLIMSSMTVLIYTNDLFTSYVFIEINTIAATSLIVLRGNGHSIVAGMKYVMMSLIGSGMLLLAISMLYDLTGHLLMTPLRQSLEVLAKSDSYHIPFTVIIALFCVGFAMKSALYPFHTWLPEAYGYGTPSASAILSSLVSKSYIFLLIKIFYRVIGMDIILTYHIQYLLFWFAIIGMMMGSINAMKERDIRRMVAYSSVAQIGYLYMGIGFGTEAGIVASLFHILAHSSAKALLFLSSSGLSSVSGNNKELTALKGAGLRNPLAGIGFVVGAFSMIGIPMFTGFISKVYFAQAALKATPMQMGVALVALAISTMFNAIYFMRAVLYFYSPKQGNKSSEHYTNGITFTISILCFVILNIALGFASYYLILLLEKGILHFY